MIGKERLAVFDSEGRFGGVDTYQGYVSMGAGSSSLYYALTALVCETSL